MAVLNNLCYNMSCYGDGFKYVTICHSMVTILKNKCPHMLCYGDGFKKLYVTLWMVLYNKYHAMVTVRIINVHIIHATMTILYAKRDHM